MTPTEQDKELRSLISDVMADLMVDVSLNKLLKNDGDIFEKGRQYIKSHNSRLNLIMQLITADRKRVAVEARIDEIKKYCTPSIYQAARQLNLETPKTWEVAHELGLTPMMADGRIKELKAQQESL